MGQRTIFVGGGSGGIGRAICHAFAKRGDRVVFTYHRNRDGADQLAAELGGGSRSVQLDLTDADATKAAIDAAVGEAGSLDSVIYAAGPTFEMDFVSAISPAEWARVMALDANGCFNLFHAALGPMKRQNCGSLLALTTSALKRPPKADILSAAPKAAIDMLVRVIAKEEGRNGIRANSIELGFIDAGIAAYHVAHSWSPELVEKIKAGTPLKRFGRAEEVAAAALFLCSDDASFITGQALAVDGGGQL